VQRGETDSALALLAGLDDPGALLLAADVRAAAGELEAALTLIDRLLARDVTLAGARERHQRWRTLLGREAVPVPDASATLLEPAVASVPLRIVGEAGRGGAGVVYEAFDERLGRRVALKVYHQPARDREKIEREARLPVALAGAGIVRVFDADPSNGWIAMEWLDGGSLKRRLVQREVGLLLPIERWFVPLARTLARVHDSGFVHADIKPANVLFRSFAEPVLSDFGLAREIGVVIADGSVGFMSPERLAQRPLVPADDVFALGRVLDAVLSSGVTKSQRWMRVAELAQGPERPKDGGQLLRASGLSV
jgi:serine/threonine-protein kinase